MEVGSVWSGVRDEVPVGDEGLQLPEKGVGSLLQFFLSTRECDFT